MTNNPQDDVVPNEAQDHMQDGFDMLKAAVRKLEPELWLNLDKYELRHSLGLTEVIKRK